MGWTSCLINVLNLLQSVFPRAIRRSILGRVVLLKFIMFPFFHFLIFLFVKRRVQIFYERWAGVNHFFNLVTNMFCRDFFWSHQIIINGVFWLGICRQLRSSTIKDWKSSRFLLVIEFRKSLFVIRILDQFVLCLCWVFNHMISSRSRTIPIVAAIVNSLLTRPLKTQIWSRFRVGNLIMSLKFNGRTLGSQRLELISKIRSLSI